MIKKSRQPLLPAYLILFAAAIAVLVWLFHFHGGLAAPLKFTQGSFSFLDGLRSPIAHFLLQLISVILAARVLGKVIRHFGQPAVIGEVLAGILLGPSLFGMVFPTPFHFLFDSGSLGALQVVSEFGLILFMFTVGLSTHSGEWKDFGVKASFIAHASIVVPFISGLAVAPFLYRRFSNGGVSFAAFALFCGLSFSITAFPVLARIIYDRKIGALENAKMALACAAINDVTAWVILAGIICVTRNGNLTGFLWTLTASIAGVLLLFKGVGPMLGFGFKKSSTSDSGKFVISISVLLSSALYFEWAGVHALFGAFLAGIILPNSQELRQSLVSKIEDLSSLILLPTFFAITGLRTQIGLLNTVELGLIAFGVILIAVLGKLGGTAVAARYAGLSWKNSAFLGVLMNTRGLMELVALNIGLELGILSPALFTIFVIMALVTTLMTGPCLSWMASAENLSAGHSGEKIS